MGKTLLALVGAVSMLPLVGCEGEMDDVDGEPLAWMPADAGIPPRPDASYDEDATGSDPDRVCYPVTPLADEALPRCTAATRTCVDGCAEGPDGEACRNGCWGSDETPRYTEGGANVGCNDCIFSQLITCLDRDGCDTEVAAFYCCIIDRCSMGGGDGCIQEQCAPELTAMFTCGGARAPGCFALTSGDIGRCYAEVDPPAGDGGVDDAETADHDASAGDAGVDGGAS